MVGDRGDKERRFIWLLFPVSYFPLVKADPIGDWLFHASRFVHPTALAAPQENRPRPHNVAFYISPDVLGKTKSSAVWRA